MNGERAGENERGVFERGFGHGFGVGCAAGRAVGLRGLGGDCAVVGRKLDDVRAEIGGRLAVPDGFVVVALGDVDTRAHHVELNLKAAVHARRVFNARQAAKGKNTAVGRIPAAKTDWTVKQFLSSIPPVSATYAIGSDECCSKQHMLLSRP